MSETRTSHTTPELLAQVVTDLNFVPQSAERVARIEALATDANRRIADAAHALPFDSSPYAFSAWLATQRPR
jgi:hypothetical protein